MQRFDNAAMIDIHVDAGANRARRIIAARLAQQASAMAATADIAK